MTQRTKDTIKWLINKELHEEYSYQVDNIYRFGEYDDTIIKDLIDCERDLFYNRSKGLDKIIWAELVKDDIEKYIKELEDHYKHYEKLKEGGEYNMPKLSIEQLKVIPLKELQEIVYELGCDEAYEIEDRKVLIDYYLDWS